MESLLSAKKQDGLFDFLSGAGEMGELTRAYDWSTTPLGSIAHWPQSLRTSVSIILHSKFPMFLFWGDELVQFYNDAYRPSLGNDGKHPKALGQRGEDCWQEIWPFIKPLIDQVMAGGEASWNEDQLLPIYRNGKLEDVYWTFSYSPAYDESGKVGGVFVTCNETTDKVLADARQKTSDQRFQNLVREASVGIIVLIGEEMTVEIVNDAYGKLIERTSAQLMKRPLFDVIPDAREVFYPLIHNVLTTGKPLFLYDIPYRVNVEGREISGFLNVMYQPYRESDGQISGVMAMVQDVTASMETRKVVEQREEELRFAIEATELGTFDLNPVTNKFKGNTRLKSWFGLRATEEIELPLAISIIEEKDRARVTEAIRKALQYSSGGQYDIEYTIVHPATGIGRVVRAKGKTSFNEDKIPYRFNGTLQDITEQVSARQKIQQSESRFRSMVEQAPMGIVLLTGKNMLIEAGNDKIFELWGKDKSITGMKLIDALPELEGQPFMQLLADVYSTGEPFFGNGLMAKLIRKGIEQEAYFDFVYTSLRDASGIISGVMVLATEVTTAVLATKAIEDSEARFRSMIEQAPIATCLYVGRDLKIAIANETLLGYWGKNNSVIGKPLAEAIPEYAGQPFIQLLEDVYASGKQYNGRNIPAQLKKNGVMTTCYFDFTYTPLFDPGGDVYAIMNTAVEVTDQLMARNKIEESEQRFRSLVEQAPIATCLLIGRELKIEVANEIMLGYWGKNKSVINKPLAEALPELQGQPFLQILDDVYTSGIAYTAEAARAELENNGAMVTYYFDYTYKPVFNAEGEVYGIIDSAVDVTEQVMARNKLEESELFSRTIFNDSPVAKVVFTGMDMNIRTINENMQDMLGLDRSAAGKPFMVAIPDLIDTPLMERLRHVLRTGETYHQPEEKLSFNKNGVPHTGYYNYIYKALRNTAGDIYGVMVTATDVTQQALILQRIEESEKRFRMLADSITNLAWMAEPDGDIFWYNQRWFDYTGSTLEEMKGWGWDKVHHPDHVDRVVSYFKKAWHVPEAFNITFPLRGHDGEYRWFLTQVYPVLNEDGSIYRWVGTNTDIHEQKVAEDRFRTLAESLPQLVWMTDGKGDYIYASKQWHDYSGLDPYQKDTITKLIHPDDMDTMIRHWSQSLESGEHYKTELRLKSKTGEYRWHTVQGEPVRNGEGMVINWIGAFTDIHEQKTAAKKLESLIAERTQELQRSNEDLMQFAHVTSHDLKEPVRKIKLFTNRLEHEYLNSLPETGQVFLHKVQSATDRMLAMIEGILQYSTVSSSGLKVEMVNINQLIGSIETDLEVMIGTKHAVIKRDKLPDIEGSAILLYQLFYNLINNSLKFAKQDAPALMSITSFATEQGGKAFAHITITDNGIGFEQEYVSRIFTTFTRLNSKDNYEGTGLGLALCKKIVERHHGTISATGVAGEGAVFTIVLPLRQNQLI